MKKITILVLLGIVPNILFAQSAIDAYQLSRGDLKGTARFVSMGGAFGALGGDLSTLNQNPAGIGIYRGSEIGLTLGIDMQSTESNSQGYSKNEDQTRVFCSNFGYVGSLNLNNDIMSYFNWGLSYSRISSFDRLYSGGMPNITTSMSNYIADFSNGYSLSELKMTNNYNPYWQSSADWLSILALNSYMISPVGNTTNYNGLFKDGSVGNSMFKVREKGYIDEYSINFGGNLKNTIYWGVGIGIADIDYINQTFYDEDIKNAHITASVDHKNTTTGDAYFSIDNYKHVSGSGFNLKAGLIYKPINELRFGLAIHTPTYYSLRHDFYADVPYYKYSSSVDDGMDFTDAAYFDSKFKSPWRFMTSIATVIGGRGIISFDYERVVYDDMSLKDDNGHSLTFVNDDITNYYKGQNIFRVGGEYRVTPNISLRVGYNYQMSYVKNDAVNGKEYIWTSGTNPSYTFDDDTQYITCGLGFRTGNIYVDGAYVYKNSKSEFNAFSKFNESEVPKSTIKDENSSIVLSVGYKF